ncbi:putative reverse transcriptase domain-containing protein [Tanacetum coccineum]
MQDLLPTIIAQVGDHIGNQGINGSRIDKSADDSIHEDVRNINVGNGRDGCSYKEFVACQSKEFNGAGHATYTDRFHELTRLVPHLVTPETKRIERYIYGLALSIYGMVVTTEPPTIQNAILKARVLTDNAVRNGSLKKSGEKRGNGREPSKEGNVKGDNKRARTGKVFATITNPVKKEYTGSTPKCTNCNFNHYPETPFRVCMNCNRLRHFSKDYRVGPKMVNPLNAKNPTTTRGVCYEYGGTDHYKLTCPRLSQAPGQGGNLPNQALAIERGQGCGNNGNLTRGRAFVMGAEEALKDPNIVTSMFLLNNHYATMIYDSGADYSFVSTTFMPLLDIKPSSLGFNFEIEIASGQLVEINKVIHGCKLEIEGHSFDIHLIPFGHRSFDVIIGMDWLSSYRAKIVCHERVVQIPLPHGEMLSVYRERPEEKVKHLMSAKELKASEVTTLVLEVNTAGSRLLRSSRSVHWDQQVVSEPGGSYETTSPKGYDLLHWGDLKTFFEPNEEDEIWKNQQDYNLIRWRLFDSCGVHVLLMNTGVTIHMMIEKKYPLTQEMLSRMLNRRLEVDYESEMAFELLKFTRSQLQK